MEKKKKEKKKVLLLVFEHKLDIFVGKSHQIATEHCTQNKENG